MSDNASLYRTLISTSRFLADFSHPEPHLALANHQALLHLWGQLSPTRRCRLLLVASWAARDTQAARGTFHEDRFAHELIDAARKWTADNEGGSLDQFCDGLHPAFFACTWLTSETNNNLSLTVFLSLAVLLSAGDNNGAVVNSGDFVWLRHTDGRHVLDSEGSPVNFEITSVDTLAAGTWYLLATDHPAGHEIFSGWYPRHRVTRPREEMRQRQNTAAGAPSGDAA
ncbi:hypothetical protein ACH4FX_11300 [Streptomyces sp. NPDC018019]|uniref:hypothetical protein n=1 Tax=Streptomyces sp. NPDC018019 TaxID=3365030 RepID=UPI0037A5013B